MKKREEGKRGVYAYFIPVLQKASIMTWILRLVPIPVGILTANLMADVVSCATKGNAQGVMLSGICLISAVLGLKAFEVILGSLCEQESSKAQHKCKLALYQQFLANPFDKLFSSGHGEAMERLHDDFQTVAGKSLQLYPGFWVGIVTAVAYFGYLAVKNPVIACLLLIIALLQMVPPLLVQRFEQVNYEATRKIESEITNYTFEAYYCLATVKLYDLKRWWLAGLEKLHKKYYRIGNLSEAEAHVEDAMNTLLENILKYGTYGLVGVFVLSEKLSLEVAVEAIALSGSFFAAIKTIFDKLPDFAVARTAEERLNVWFQSGENTDESFPLQNTEICLSDVSLHFEGKTILEHATSRLDAGQICLIKGANGVGKSTLMRLVVGLLKGESGHITVGGVENTAFAQQAYPRTIFYLPQEDASFHISAKKLIEMMAPAEKESVYAYAGQFGLTDAVLSDTPVSQLSGGERKKVYLSLAFALKPDILLLDEPTNSLDERGRQVLCELLQERKGGAVIITHDTILEAVSERTFFMGKEGLLYD